MGGFFCLGARVVDFEETGSSQLALKRGVDLFLLGGALILFKFDPFEDAEEVMLRGFRRFANKSLSLERWALEVGCS